MQEFSNLRQLMTYFQDEKVCLNYLEQQLWNGKPVCPHCGSERVYRLADGKIFKPQRIKDELAIEIYNDIGLTNRELAIKYSVPQTTVFNIKRGFTFKEATGAKNSDFVSNKIKGNSFYFSPEEIVEIFKATGNQSEIAKRFNTNKTQVNKIKNKRIRVDVTENL